MSFLLKKDTAKLLIFMQRTISCLQQLAEKGDIDDSQPLLDIMDKILPETIEKRIVHMTVQGKKWLCIMVRKKEKKVNQPSLKSIAGQS